MNTKAFFLCWEGSNLILGTGKENQIFIQRTPATIKLFHQILKKWWVVVEWGWWGGWCWGCRVVEGWWVV